MGYFDGFGQYSNNTSVSSSTVVPTGDSAKIQNGNSYTEQTGNATTFSVGNANTLRRGVSNTLTEGFSFSTTLGASFSTIAGTNTAATGGGYIQVITPFALKSTIGWDVDVKLGKQIKITNDDVKNLFKKKQVNVNIAGEDEVLASHSSVIADQDLIVGDQSIVVQNLDEKVGQSFHTIGTLHESVLSDSKEEVLGVKEQRASEVRTSNLLGTAALDLKASGNVKLQGLKIDLQGSILNLN